MFSCSYICSLLIKATVNFCRLLRQRHPRDDGKQCVRNKHFCFCIIHTSLLNIVKTVVPNAQVASCFFWWFLLCIFPLRLCRFPRFLNARITPLYPLIAFFRKCVYFVFALKL